MYGDNIPSVVFKSRKTRHFCNAVADGVEWVNLLQENKKTNITDMTHDSHCNPIFFLHVLLYTSYSVLLYK